MKVTVRVQGLDGAIYKLDAYSLDLQEKGKQICERLASLGALHASLGFSRALYEGIGSADITAEPTDNGYAILASGTAVLFLEFGAGVTMGYGHPQAAEFGYGPGTYPGKGRWDNPKGWWFTGAQGSQHSYGNPPNMAMYNAAKEIEREVERVAREVLAT